LIKNNTKKNTLKDMQHIAAENIDTAIVALVKISRTTKI